MRGAQAEFLHEHVGGGRQEDAQLVRPELAAARTVDLQTVEQLLDAVLDIAAGTVDFLVDKARRLAQIGDDEARVRGPREAAAKEKTPRRAARGRRAARLRL